MGNCQKLTREQGNFYHRLWDGSYSTKGWVTLDRIIAGVLHHGRGNGIMGIHTTNFKLVPRTCFPTFLSHTTPNFFAVMNKDYISQPLLQLDMVT